MLVPVSRMMILASVELSGELMQEIHQIWHWNELEANLYFVLIILKAFLTFPFSWKHKEQTNTNENLFWAPSPFITKYSTSHMQVFTYIDKLSFPHFGQFSKRWIWL